MRNHRKTFALVTAFSALTFVSVVGLADRSNGRAIDRGDDYGCSFRCPAGVNVINSVDFSFSVAGVRVNKVDRDGGILICRGEERVVGRVIPSAAGFFVRNPRCAVNFTTVIQGAQNCDQDKLDTCLAYDGGTACYEKWCT